MKVDETHYITKTGQIRKNPRRLTKDQEIYLKSIEQHFRQNPYDYRGKARCHEFASQYGKTLESMQYYRNTDFKIYTCNIKNDIKTGEITHIILVFKDKTHDPTGEIQFGKNYDILDKTELNEAQYNILLGEVEN